MGDVAEGLVLDFSAFAEGTAQEVRDVHLAPLPVSYGGYMYGSISARHWRYYRHEMEDVNRISKKLLATL